MNDTINTNIMDSLNYNTNLNIGIEMYKKFILNNNNKKYIILDNISSSFILSHRLVLNDGKYRTQRRNIFLPFLLHVQPSTKVCLSKDRICGGSHECIMYTEFPKFTDNSLSLQWNPCLTPRIAKTIAITTELNNTFFSYIQFISAKLTPLPKL